MAKAAIAVSGVSGRGTDLHVSYSVSLDNGSRFGSSFKIDFAATPAVNLANFRTQVIQQAADRGVTLLATDIVTWGVPT